jgi:hypothetical protein
MTDSGPLSIGERFKRLEDRMARAEEQIVEMRLQAARTQLKLAVAVGFANLLAFGLVEFAAMWLTHLK